MNIDLAAVVLTKNEERHIGDCLDSLAWVDERVVFDDFSSDGTVEIAQARGARVISHALENFCDQRNRYRIGHALPVHIKSTFFLFFIGAILQFSL